MQLNRSTALNQPLSKNQSFPKNLIIFCHLRWDFVYQRPQHLASRIAEQCKLYYIEEPIFNAHDTIHYEIVDRNAVTVMVPHLKPGYDHQTTIDGLTTLFSEFIAKIDLSETAFWYYTPMALEFTGKFEPAITIYDCMDELSAFKFAPVNLQTLEKELLGKADVVFTGGQSLYEAKKTSHRNIHPFPSSIDKAHFLKAREKSVSPDDQVRNALPKMGFYGVIDERFDIELIDYIAAAHPDWQIILIGPVVKIDPGTLPQRPNIQYLGSKTYDELPEYMAGWDVALIPFLINESTRFISPTKTPEYLAAGLPVVSTPITDVVDPYGEAGLVSIGHNQEEFTKLIEQTLSERDNETERLRTVDDFLALNSWDQTFEKMENEIMKVITHQNNLKTNQYV